MAERSLIDKIKMGARYKEKILWPGTDDYVEIAVLTEQDELDAMAAAEKNFKDINVSSHNFDSYLAEKTTQLLFRCLYNPETGEKLFKNISNFRAILTPEVKGVLDEEQARIQKVNSPKYEELTEEEFDKIVFDIKKKPVEDILGNISNIGTLKKLITYLVSQPTN